MASFVGAYINLDRSIDRAAVLTARLRQLGLADVYHRVSGVDGGGPGAPAINACFESHLKALEFAKGARADTVHIIEDDVELSAHAVPFAKSARAKALLDRHDLVFLDMWIDPETYGEYSRLLSMSRRVKPPKYEGLSVLNLFRKRIGAAASYLVKRDKIDRVLNALRGQLNVVPRLPVDLTIGALVAARKLQAAVVIPFLTSIDPDTPSLIQVIDYRTALRMRRAFFVDATTTELPQPVAVG